MDKKVLFEALDTELAKENISLEIICVGGFVLDTTTFEEHKMLMLFIKKMLKSEALLRKLAMILV